MAKRRYDDKLHINMPFAEAVDRFVHVDPKEMEANIRKAKKKKPPGGKKLKPPGATGDDRVVSLRDRRMRKRNYGL